MKNLTDQQKGSLLAFVAVMFITPDSLFIRLSNVDTWGLVFYRGIIPFMSVLIGMLIIYKLNFFKILFTSGYHGMFYVIAFSVTNITFVVSIQNTNVANTLVMIATAPMLSAILGAIFLKEPPDKKTWTSIITVSYTHLRAHETGRKLVCRLLLEKKKHSQIVLATAQHQAQKVEQGGAPPYAQQHSTIVYAQQHRRHS